MARLIGMEFWSRVNETLGDVSLRSVCEKNGLVYGTYRNARNSHRLLSLENCRKLADALGVSSDWLLNGSQDEAQTVDLSQESPFEFVGKHPEMFELIELCQKNPAIISNLIAMAKFATGSNN